MIVSINEILKYTQIAYAISVISIYIEVEGIFAANSLKPISNHVIWSCVFAWTKFSVSCR